MKNICKILIFILSIFLFQSCKKDKPALPTVETTEVTGISTTTAISGGAVTSEGGASVASRGVCWGTSTKPTITNGLTIDGNGLGVYTSNITNLLPNTTYYLRAYALSSVGIAYGNELSFKTLLLSTPSLTTSDISSITYNSAVSGGTITSENGEPVTARGVCWDTLSNPTILNKKTVDNSGIGSFVSSITGLQQGTKYYVRAYATNSLGTAYGNEQNFTTPEITAIDNDGNVYKSINIGTQIWFKENLETTKYNDGTSITLITDSLQWTNLTTDAFCWFKNDPSTYKATYGALYNWYSAATGKLCPAGWHVPSDAEWTTLTDYLGGLTVAGGKMKEVGTTHWMSPNTGATNESGFTSFAAGQRATDGTFTDFGKAAIWWSSTPYNELKPWYCSNYYTTILAGHGNGTLNNVGLSIRCIKD